MKYIMGIFVPTYPIILENAAIFNPVIGGAEKWLDRTFITTKRHSHAGQAAKNGVIKWTIRARP